MAFYFGPTQLSMDPESSQATIQNAAKAMITEGTTVAKKGRVYKYVLFDTGATLPAAGGLVYMLSAATWGPGNSFNVTNGALAATGSGNFALGVGIAHLAGSNVAGNFGFIQTKGDSFVAVLATTTGVFIGSTLVSNLTNAANPERVILATTTNLPLTNIVAYASKAVGTNVVQAQLVIEF